MGQFIIFIDIKVVHGYYDDLSSSFLFRPTAETERLMRSREVLIRRTGNGCQFMIQDDSAGFLSGDELEFALQPQDPSFILFTQLEGYHPQAFHRLVLPEDSQEVDVASAIIVTEEQKRESHFCHITIKPTDKLLKKAKAGIPQEYLLRFREAAYRWEYLFIPRYESMDESKTFLLVDTQRKLFFTLPEKYTDPAYGGMMWRFFLHPLLLYVRDIGIATCNCLRCRQRNSPACFPKHSPEIYSRRNSPSCHRKYCPGYFPRFSLVDC